MIGIYGIISKSYEVLNYNKYFKITSLKFGKKVFQNKDHIVGLIYPLFNKDYAFAESEGSWILIDGFVFDDEGKQINATDLLDIVNQKSIKALEKFNGEFFIAIFNKSSLIFINDIMGQRQHCIADKGMNWSIAPSPGQTIGLLGIERSINKEALFVFINTKKLRHHKKTIWNNSEIIESASIIKFENESISVNKYWEYEHVVSRNEFSVDEFIDIYKQAVNIRIVNDDVGITLTGGLDSRSIIGALEKDNLNSLLATTMGIEDCDEVNLAEMVANQKNVSHKPFYFNAETVFSKESLDYFIFEDIDLLVQGLWSPFTKSLNSISYLLHGLDLDVTLGGIYLTDKLLNIDSDKEFKDFVLKDNLRLSKETYNKLFKKEFLEGLGKNVDSYLFELVEECKSDTYTNTYDKFIMRYSMNRVILQRYRGIRSNIETISPMYDRNIIDYLLSIPTEQRANYKAFFPFINKLTPDLAQIPYQRTTLPANVPVKFWKKAQSIQADIEELYREIAFDSNGDDYIPYMRYYTNVDEWLRFNSKWISMTKELLQSKKSIIRKEWLNEQYLDEIIFEHQAHKKSNFGIIHTLMSAELFLRYERYGFVNINEFLK